jgi:hypothetical protein
VLLMQSMCSVGRPAHCFNDGVHMGSVLGSRLPPPPSVPSPPTTLTHVLPLDTPRPQPLLDALSLALLLVRSLLIVLFSHCSTPSPPSCTGARLYLCKIAAHTANISSKRPARADRVAERQKRIPGR